jgi:hypothetical protein
MTAPIEKAWPEPDAGQRALDLRAAFAGLPCEPWLDEAADTIWRRSEALTGLFAAAARHCGRQQLAAAPGWTADEAARTILLSALELPEEALIAHVEEVYVYGDAAEKRAVLRALPLLPVGDRAVPLLHDAIRTNDPRLLAAAVGPYARRLDAALWRQAVLKCVFTGVPLDAVHALRERADTQLMELLEGYALERRAAGRDVPADAAALLQGLGTEEGGA